jgi:hypothetical protein
MIKQTKDTKFKKGIHYSPNTEFKKGMTNIWRIEADGNYFHNYPLGNEIDIIRNNELREKGFKVLRLWEFEIRAMELGDLKNKLIQMEIIK